MPRLSQETLAILGVGVALAALMLTDSVGVRGEFQAVRGEFQAVRAEIQAVRGEIQAVRSEAHADREAIRAAHETFQSHILRLTEQQGILRARLDAISDLPAPSR